MSSNPIVQVGVDSGAQQPGSPSGSRPLGGAGLIFDAIQKGTAKAPVTEVAKPEDKPKVEQIPSPAELAKASEAAVLADAGKAPAAVDKDKSKGTSTSQSVRALVKSSNIPAEFKDQISDLAYLGRAMQEQGMSLDALKLFREQGITPQSVTERLKLHPTFADAHRDSLFAAEMRRVASDFNTDPGNFILRLQQSSQNNPAVFGKFIEVASTYLEKHAKPTWTAMATDALKTALYNLGREAVAEKDEDKQTAVRIVQENFGFDTGMAPPRPQRDPKLVELEQQNAALLQNQKQAEDAGKDAFLASVVTQSRNSAYKEIVDRWTKTAPAGLTPEENKRAVDDIFRGVEADLQSVQNFVYDMQLRRNGPRTEQSFREAVKYAFDRALPLIPNHQKAAIDFWSPIAIARTQLNETKGNAAAQQTDAAGTGTAGAVVPEPTDTPASRMKALKAKGGFTFKDLVAATLAGRTS